MSKSFRIHAGGHQGCLGISLRGSCSTPDEAAQLEQATQRLLARRPQSLWVDGRQLLDLSLSGQHILLRTETLARAAGVACYYCGFTGHVLSQLASNGVSQQLQLRPSSDFGGPSFILPD